MWKNKKIIIISVVAAVVLLIGATVGIAFAANPPVTERQPGQLMARVAEIVGVPQDKLEAAFKQAAQEMREQRMNEHMQNLIDQGQITQQQADKYKEWLKSKPDFNLPRPEKPLRGAFQQGGPLPGLN